MGGGGTKPDQGKRGRARELRDRGLSLGQIAEALGITRQGAHYLLAGRVPRRNRRPLHCPRCGRQFQAVGLPGEEGPCVQCLKGPGPVTVGDRVRAHRLAAGLTRAELTRRAGLGNTALRRLERGTVRPISRTLARLAEALGVGVAELDPLRAARPAARAPRPTR
jgi:transcriptional regulator with XRE-family HTH domain